MTRILWCAATTAQFGLLEAKYPWWRPLCSDDYHPCYRRHSGNVSEDIRAQSWGRSSSGEHCFASRGSGCNPPRSTTLRVLTVVHHERWGCP